MPKPDHSSKPQDSRTFSVIPAIVQLTMLTIVLVIVAGCGTQDGVTEAAGFQTDSARVEPGDNSSESDNHSDAESTDVSSDVTNLMPDCADVPEATVARCAEKAEGLVLECTMEIAALSEAGLLEEAHKAAFTCIEQLHALSSECLAQLRKNCQACLFVDSPTDQLDADSDLPDACRMAAERILTIRRIGIGAVDAALDRAVARHCVETVSDLSEKCVARNAEVARVCIARIEELLANGEIVAANKEAMACIGSIREQSGNCAHAIQELCHRCLERLMRDCGDDELIHLVGRACRTALESVRESARRAAHAVRNALPQTDP